MYKIIKLIAILFAITTHLVCWSYTPAYLTENPFADIMGMTESAFRKLTPQEQVHAFAPFQHQAGTFSLISLRELKHMLPTQSQSGTGRLSIIVGNVCSLQAHPANSDAVFQVASNYNAIESQSEKALTLLENYLYDPTQGPFASISAMPALIWRHYFSMNGHAQQENNMINLLARTPLGIHVVGGYLQLPQSEALAALVTSADTWYDELCIGMHRDVWVTHWAERASQYTIGNIHRLPAPYHSVNQVFFAAIDFALLNAQHKHDPQAHQLARLILKAAYEGTLIAAAAYGKHKVFLTMVGCGVFENDANWIAPILLDNMPFIKQYGLDVYLVLGSPHELKKFSSANQNLLKSITLGSNGSYMDNSYTEQIQHYIAQNFEIKSMHKT